MTRWVRRILWLGLLAAAGYGGYQLVIRRRTLPAATASTDQTEDLGPIVDAGALGRPAPHMSRRWTVPVDGRCPDGYPIKTNGSSRIFHVPGGRFYDRTVPERCYASADDAAVDGYRAAKA